MPDEFTPLQSSAPLSYAVPLQFQVTAWSRDGDWLVGPHGVPFPDRCIKCNRPVTTPWRWKRTLHWHKKTYYLLLLMMLPGLLIYLIVNLLVRKHVRVSVALCEVHRGERRRRLRLFSSVAVLGIIIGLTALVAGSVNQSRFGDFAAIGISVAICAIATATAAILYIEKVINIQQINEPLVWYSGVGKEFLSALEIQSVSSSNR